MYMAMSSFTSTAYSTSPAFATSKKHLRSSYPPSLPSTYLTQAVHT